jgi:hypothetical protein
MTNLDSTGTLDSTELERRLEAYLLIARKVRRTA